MGGELALGPFPDAARRDRLRARLIADLWVHEPRLKRAFDAWTGAFNRFQGAQAGLTGLARRQVPRAVGQLPGVLLPGMAEALVGYAAEGAAQQRCTGTVMQLGATPDPTDSSLALDGPITVGTLPPADAARVVQLFGSVVADLSRRREADALVGAPAGVNRRHGGQHRRGRCGLAW